MRNGLYLAWIVAIAGTILSFYFGEIERIEPCPLCWYQRMCLFPLVVILGIAIYRGDQSIVLYALPFSFLGVILAVYQNFEPYLAFLQKTGICGEEGCSEPVFTLWGFFTFPVLSAIGFLLITIFLSAAKK